MAKVVQHGIIFLNLPTVLDYVYMHIYDIYYSTAIYCDCVCKL